MKPIIFIGPIGAGKSTIAKMVAEELSIPSFSLDEEEHLAASVGFEIERYKRMWKENGLLDAYEYRRSFYDRLVPLFLESHVHGVLDFGRKDVFLLPNRRFRWNSLRSLCRA